MGFSQSFALDKEGIQSTRGMKRKRHDKELRALQVEGD